MQQQRSLPCVLDFGVVGNGSDETVAIKAAHDAVRAEGRRFLYFPYGRYHAPSLLAAADVIFVGEGTLTGAYRKRIIPSFAPTPPLLAGNIHPARHLAWFARALRTDAGAIVTMVGDSITTLADAIAPTEGIWENLQRKIRSDNPGRRIMFHHRAFGGGLWATLNATLPHDTLPDWACDPHRPWLAYVEATNPDLLIIHFGMNDGNGLKVAARDSVIAKIAQWAKQPDIILCTNYAPSLQDPTYQADANMEGRDAAAGLTRTWAALKDYGLVDINRRFNLVRDGFDAMMSTLERVVSDHAFTLTSATPWPFPVFTHDFALTFSIADAASLWGDGQRRLAVQIGRNAGNQVILEQDRSGRLAFEVETVAGIASVSRFVTGITAPTGGRADFLVVARGGWLHVESGGALLFDGPCERWGGRFRSHLRYLDAPDGRLSGHISALAVSRPLDFMPQATDRELFGERGGATGGNGINHPSSMLVAMVYGPVLAASDFCASAGPG